MKKNDKIYIAGFSTMVGQALIKKLKILGYSNILERPEPDLTNFDQVNSFFSHETPKYVFLVAGKSGGIGANQRYPAQLIFDNLLVECNAIDSAYRHGVKKLLYLASSCCYPKNCPQPIQEEYLLTGPLEPTNQAYAVAKIAGIELCKSYYKQYGVKFITAISANAFGPLDDFSLEDSHVISALIRKMHEAKENQLGSVDIWGSGSPRRDFIFVDDLVEACVLVMLKYDDLQPINLGSGKGVSIKQLAQTVKEVVGYSGRLHFDRSKPDGMKLKVLDSGKLKKLGFKARMPLKSAILKLYQYFLNIQKKHD